MSKASEFLEKGRMFPEFERPNIWRQGNYDKNGVYVTYKRANTALKMQEDEHRQFCLELGVQHNKQLKKACKEIFICGDCHFIGNISEFPEASGIGEYCPKCGVDCINQLTNQEWERHEKIVERKVAEKIFEMFSKKLYLSGKDKFWKLDNEDYNEIKSRFWGDKEFETSVPKSSDSSQTKKQKRKEKKVRE